MKQRWIGAILFLIGVIMSVLTNVVSGDLEIWYRTNRVVAWLIILILILAGVALMILSTDHSRRRRQANLPQSPGLSTERRGKKDSVVESSSSFSSLERQLAIARQVLEVYEEQAAGYTTLTIPAQLKFNLDEQRRKVADLEAQLPMLRSGGHNEQRKRT